MNKHSNPAQVAAQYDTELRERRAEQIEDLAERILDYERRQADLATPSLRGSYPWYMMNLRNPAALALYTAWHGQQGAPGDRERLEWELGLMTDDVLEALEELYPPLEVRLPGETMADHSKRQIRRLMGQEGGGQT